MKTPNTGKHLFIDDHLVAEKKGFRTTMNPAIKEPEPVLVADRPWECHGIGADSGITVMKNGGLYKMWYMARLAKAPVPGPARFKKLFPEIDLGKLDEKTRKDMLSLPRIALCYATSRDGIHWEKPELGVASCLGSRKNNIVLIGRLGGSVFVDSNGGRKERYKIICGNGPRLPHHPYDAAGKTVNMFQALYGATSPDGIHWTWTETPVIPWYVDTTTAAFWDDRIGKYVAYVRINQDLVFRDGETWMTTPGGWKYRAVGRTESEDFYRFPPPVKVHAPTAAEWKPRHVGLDYYNTSAIKYPFAEDAYFLFSCNNYNDRGTLAVHLATSRDGVRFHRHKQQPFVGLGTDGAFDRWCTYMAVGMLPMGDEIWMYYHGKSTPHLCPRYPRGSRIYRGPRGVGRVRIRRDGFVSQDAGSGGGVLVTEPFRMQGRRLEVNVDAGAGGDLKVEILNNNGRPRRGYGLKQTNVIERNHLHKTVTWKGDPDVSSLAGKPIRLRFTGRRVKLYAFQFTK